MECYINTDIKGSIGFIIHVSQQDGAFIRIIWGDKVGPLKGYAPLAFAILSPNTTSITLDPPRLCPQSATRLILDRLDEALQIIGSHNIAVPGAVSSDAREFTFYAISDIHTLTRNAQKHGVETP